MQLTYILVIIFFFLTWGTLQAQFCNSTGCFNCHYRCLVCNGPLASQCTTCTQNYLLVNGTCSSCTQNCISCSTLSLTNACQTCAGGYYLAQSTGTCSSCAQGAQTCTFSAVQQCLPGYYLLNSVCFFCLSNCLTCTNAYSCSHCQPNYYLTAQSTCNQCLISNCATCSSDGTCSLCNTGFYGSNCTNSCPLNCDICDQTSCYQCSTTYLMGTAGCEPMSILCSFGASYSMCFQCVGEIAFMSGQQCVPYHYVRGTNLQEYYTPLNNPDIFGTTLAYCPTLNLYYSYQTASLTLSINIQPSFAISITIQTFTPSINSPLNLSLSSPNLTSTATLAVTSTQSSNCNNQNITLSNFKYTFSTYFTQPQSTYILSLTIANQNNSLVGVSQLLVEEMPCGVTNCGICYSSTACQYCLPNFYLENNICLSQCSQGYYLTLAMQICTLTCPDTFYPILADYLCQICQPPCLTCSSSSACLSCLSGTYLSGSVCSSSCPSGYFPDVQQGQCQSCRYPCKNCLGSSSTCLSCSLGYLSGSSCVMSCPSGSFANFTVIACQSCSTPCLTCSMSASTCTSCPSGLILQPNSTCLSTCDSTHINASGICSQCLHPCSTCTSLANSCNGCISGFLFNSTCLTRCPSLYYGDTTTKVCLQCSISCLECVSMTQCRSCSQGYYFYKNNQSCLSQCPLGTQILNITCQLCPQPCSTCDINGCLSCQGNLFVLYNNSCLLACPSSTYISLVSSNKICSNCGSSCSSCISSTECISCSNNTLLQGGACLSSCLYGYYASTGSCSSCVFPCLECSGSDLCLSCQTGYYHQVTTLSCLSNCPSGTFNSNGTCLTCNSACSLCKDASTNCLQCSINHFKSLITNQCLSSCQSGYYGYSPQRNCRGCSNQCLTCLSQSSCLSCQANSSYPYLHMQTCVANCPNKYFAFNSTQCLPCDLVCATCQTSSNNCTSCPLSFIFTASLNTCSINCLSSFYDGGSGICQKCNQPCLTCNSPTFCLSCLTSSLALFNGKCLSNCPSTYFSFTINTTLTCSPCSLECLSCSGSSTFCTQCPPSLYLLNGTCLGQCPSGTHPDSISSNCLSCNSPCLLCHSSSKCKTCINGYLLYLDLCVVNCPSGYFASSNNTQCQLCISPCSTCSSTNSCTSCVSGYTFDSTTFTCLSTCPSQTYSLQTSSGSIQCITCASSCLQCFDGTACKSCNSSSIRPYLQATVCQSSCTSGYFSVAGNFTCQSCSQWCLSCTSNTNCSKCSSGYLLQGSCIAICPLTYYPSLAFVCQMCLSPCQTCFDAANCQTCIPGHYLYLTHCLPSCPPDQWTVTNPNICNSTCLAPYFTLTPSKSCTKSCTYYHSPLAQCLVICPQKSMANRTFGCQECSTADCSHNLNYQVTQQQLLGQLQLILIFNQPLDNYQSFMSAPEQSLKIINTATNVPTTQELDISAFRHLQQSSTFSFMAVQASSQKITIQLHFTQQLQPFSGQISLSITNLSILTSQGYPLQSTNYTLQIQWFHPAPQAEWIQYFSYILTITYFFCFVVNFIFDNTKVVIPLTDSIQTLHLLFYIQAWFHPTLTNFMLGFKVAVLRLPFLNSMLSSWDCPAKSQIVFGGCSLYSEIALPLILFFIIVLINILLSRMKYFRQRSWMSWGHFYILWWLCSPGIAVSSFTYVTQASGIEFIIACILCTIFTLSVMLLGFQIIKNVYNKSYAQRVFFWNIRKKAGQLANLHALLLIVRRTCLVISIGVASQSPLGVLFILTLITIYIISNWFISKSLRKMVALQITSELLFGIFMILLQMSIINATTVSNQVWQALGWIMTLIAFSIILALTILTLIQTIICLKKNIKKIKSRKNSEQGSEREQSISVRQSHTSQESKISESSAGLNSKEKKRELVEKNNNQTENQLLKMNTLTFSPKQRISFDGFSQVLEGATDQRDKKVPQKLIKILKDPPTQSKND